MTVTQCPTLEEALTLHRLLLERFGGQGGVRDLGLLEAALGRPRSGYYPTLALQAAALLQSLAGNHPFVDGHKRVALALTLVLLRMNGYVVVASADAVERFLVDEVIVGRAEVGAIASWLSAHLVVAPAAR